MHILGGLLIGLVVGRGFSLFTLRKLKGGKYTFMVVGMVGSIGTDLIFKTLYERNLVSSFFYTETSIIVEMVVGALAACYLVNLLGRQEQIPL
jgi:uncharacterized membrane protein YeaQ/YmgE (transglycosylase-associated protein family)